MFPPQLKYHTLAFITLIQPTGSVFPVAELQSRYFVALMLNKCHLPSTEKMLAYVRKKTEGFRELEIMFNLQGILLRCHRCST
ncbi:dimethylaniline monooxygenase [Trichonephila clavipes]|nr:dimethylaniline monooxygenase [Trichonephila clavipes]